MRRIAATVVANATVRSIGPKRPTAGQSLPKFAIRMIDQRRALPARGVDVSSCSTAHGMARAFDRLPGAGRCIGTQKLRAGSAAMIDVSFPARSLQEDA